MGGNLETIRELAARWNAGEHERVLDLYTDDVVMARFQDEWASAWESVELKLSELVERDDKVLVIGGWDSRGSVSGVGGRIPFGIVFTMRDGLIARFEWHFDPKDTDALVEEQRNLEVVRRLAESWNAGDIEAVLEFYADDIETITDPQWPEPPTSGKEAFRRSSYEWRDAWAQVDVDVDGLEAHGDKVAVAANWVTEGAVSGVAGNMPFGVLYTLRDGLISRMQWFMDPEEARRAAQ